MAVLKLSQIAAAGANPALTDQIVGVTGGATDNLLTVAQVFGAQNLVSDASNILALRNGTNAQTLRVYNTFTDASNYERGIIDWNGTANTLTIATEAAGTGTVRDIIISAASGTIKTMSTGSLYLSNTNNQRFTWPNGAELRLFSNGSQLVGFNGGTSSVNFGTNAVSFGTSPGFNSDDTFISRSAAGVLAFGTAGSGDANATIKAKTKAGAPTTADVPAGTWVLIRDTTNATTKLYYNNAGTLQSVALA